MLLIATAFAAVPCNAPTNPDEARAWRADDGAFYAELQELDRIVRALQDEPECPEDVWLEGYAPNWFGGCETTSGYWIEVEGVAGGAYEETWLSWELEIVATGRADGSLPQGSFLLEMEGRSSSSGTTYGSSKAWTATWSIDPTTSTVLRPEATLVYRWGEGNLGGCATRTASFETTLDGCPFTGESASTNGVWTHALAGDAWRLDVATSVCGSTLANGRFVDPETWAGVARTDVDGDGCAVEDCDCDDSDATVSPLAVDEAGDGRDIDCDGRDEDFAWECDGLSYTCADPAADTDTAPPLDEDEPRPIDEDDPRLNDRAGCGCDGSGAPTLIASLIAAAGASQRARRRAWRRHRGETGRG